MATAFALGLLLFLLIWMSQQKDTSFFRAAPASSAGDARGFEPLPTPDAAGTDSGNAQAVIGAPPPTEELSPTPPVPVSPPKDVVPSGQGSRTAQSGSTSAIAVEHPAPRYPPRALRNGDAGTVLLQVEVDAQGRPVQVDVVQSSRSRELDREARHAVQRWTFKPATRNGQPVSSKVLVPVDFKADR